MNISVDTRQGGRSQQEDRFFIGCRPNYTVAAVMDGHGGFMCAAAIEASLARNLDEHDARGSITRIVRETSGIKSGSTLTQITFLPNGRALAAIIGDSPLIVKLRGSDKLIVPSLHNARENEDERNQAIMRGAVYTPRGYLAIETATGLKGLQMSRALGDVELSFVSHEPDFHQFTLPIEWAILATDGLFKSHQIGLSELAAIEMVMRIGHEGESAELINVISPQSDNVTVIVVRP